MIVTWNPYNYELGHLIGPTNQHLDQKHYSHSVQILTSHSYSSCPTNENFLKF